MDLYRYYIHSKLINLHTIEYVENNYEKTAAVEDTQKAKKKKKKVTFIDI